MSQLKVDFFIKNLVEVINKLQHCDVKENLNEIVISGNWDQNAAKLIIDCISLQESSKHEVFSLSIDSEPEDLEDASNISSGNHVSLFTFTFRKDIFLEKCGMISDEIDIFLLSSVNALHDSLVQLGISSPLLKFSLNKNKATKILVHGLQHNFGGPYLAIHSTSGSPDHNVFLRGSTLPDSDSIRKEVNTISNLPIEIVPQFFEMCWGNIDSVDAKPFRIAYAKQMIACLAQYVYSEEKIQLKGVKSLECSIVDDGSTDMYLPPLKRTVLTSHFESAILSR